MPELKDVKRGVPGSGCGGGGQARLTLLTPSFRCLFRGPPLLSLGPWPLPSPLNPAPSADWSLARQGAGPESPDVTGGGGEWLGEGGDGLGSAPRRAPSPALFCSGIAAGGGSQGAGTRAAAGGWP